MNQGVVSIPSTLLLY